MRSLDKSVFCTALGMSLAAGHVGCSAEPSSAPAGAETPCQGPGCEEGTGPGSDPSADGGTPDGSASPPAAAPWMHLHTGPAYDRVWSVDAMPDGGAVVVIRGSKTKEGFPSGGAVVRIDPAGKVSWTRAFACTGSAEWGISHAFAAPGGEVDFVSFCESSTSVDGYSPGATSLGPWNVFHLRDSDGTVASHVKLAADAKVQGALRAAGGKIYFAFKVEAGAMVGGVSRAAGGMVGAFTRDTGALAFGVAAADWNPYGLDVEPSGHVWVGGGFKGSLTLGDKSATSSGVYDGMLARVASDGSVTYLRTFGGAVQDQDHVDAISIGEDGNVYVLGTTTKGANVGGDALVDGDLAWPRFVASYDPSGAHRWSRVVASGTLSSASSLVWVSGAESLVVGGTHLTTDPTSTVHAKWLVFDGAGKPGKTRELGVGPRLDFTTPSSAKGRVLYGGSFTTEAQLLGKQETTPDRDAFMGAEAP